MSELEALDILDTPPEPNYDDLAALAAAICRGATGAINFVAADRHFTKAVTGSGVAPGANVLNPASFCAATVCSPAGELVISDTATDPRWSSHPLIQRNPQVGFYAGVSVESRGHRVGVVCAFGERPRTVTEGERRALAILARQVERQLELRRRNAELRRLAVTDALTGAGNRTLLMDRLDHALVDRERSGEDVGLLFCDIDDFKVFNDDHGHQVGDRVLCMVAERLREIVRAADTVARISGDEFVVVCPRVTPAAFADIAARVAAAVEELDVGDGLPAVRVSVGAAIAEPEDSAAALLRRADDAMYAMKLPATRR
ncbi:MAG TPA: diguanylate cyclase [Baekduia sp.]|nr:diguanylate cyclase [Baekduia sp.]